MDTKFNGHKRMKYKKIPLLDRTIQNFENKKSRYLSAIFKAEQKVAEIETILGILYSQKTKV